MKEGSSCAGSEPGKRAETSSVYLWDMDSFADCEVDHQDELLVWQNVRWMLDYTWTEWSLALLTHSKLRQSSKLMSVYMHLLRGTVDNGDGAVNDTSPCKEWLQKMWAVFTNKFM
jgi:hypothetical protein